MRLRRAEVWPCQDLHCTCLSPQLALAKACAGGSQLGLEGKACSESVCQLFQASQAVNKQQIFSVQKGLSDTMR